MKMNKKLLATFLFLGLLVYVATLTGKAVLADETGDYSPIVTRLAEKFNLTESDVQAVFDSVHDEHHNRMLQDREDKLDQAVTDGVITEEQKQALLNKWEEMHTEREQERLQNHEEMQAWFQEQGIDMEALNQYMGFGPHHFGGPGHMGM
jgi:hypothetical protein